MVRALGLFVRGKSDLGEGIYSRDWSDDRAGEQLAQVNQRLGELQVAGQDSKDGGRGRASETPKDGQNVQED